MRTMTKTRKVIAGFGMVLLMGGGYLTVSPSAGASHDPVDAQAPAPVVLPGNQPCAEGDFDIKFDPSGEGAEEYTLTMEVPYESGAKDVTITYTTELVGGVQHYYWSSTDVVSQVIVKQANDSAVFTYDPPSLSGTAYVKLSDGATASSTESSHISFCLTTVPDTTTTTESTTTTSTTSTTVQETTTTSVLGEQETTTTTQATSTTATPTTAKTAVLGAVTTRTLPRTGSTNTNLAGAGAVMVLLGAALVAGSSRRQADVG